MVTSAPWPNHANIFILSPILGLKVSIIIFLFIWVRASYPRIRYDQLMALL